MKKWYKNKSNIFTLLVVAFVLWRQVPQFFKNQQFEGLKIEAQSYPIISSVGEQSVWFPPKGRSLTIFWATWCAPCKLEMNRLQSSIQDGKMKAHQIFAINPFETGRPIAKFLKENQYSFTFLDAPNVANELKIALTPTTIMMEKETISSMSTGLSIIGIWNAERFLQN